MLFGLILPTILCTSGLNSPLCLCRIIVWWWTLFLKTTDPVSSACLQTSSALHRESSAHRCVCVCFCRGHEGSEVFWEHCAEQDIPQHQRHVCVCVCVCVCVWERDCCSFLWGGDHNALTKYIHTIFSPYFWGDFLHPSPFRDNYTQFLWHYLWTFLTSWNPDKCSQSDFTLF